MPVKSFLDRLNCFMESKSVVEYYIVGVILQITPVTNLAEFPIGKLSRKSTRLTGLIDYL